MEPPDPPTLKDAGDLVFPDVLVSLPEQLIALTAFAWILFAPVWIGVAVRAGRGKRALVIYTGGTILAAVFFTFQSGRFGEPLAHRWEVWAKHIWLPLLGAAFVLGVIAVLVGHVIRRSRQPAKKGTF